MNRGEQWHDLVEGTTSVLVEVNARRVELIRDGYAAGVLSRVRDSLEEALSGLVASEGTWTADVPPGDVPF